MKIDKYYDVQCYYCARFISSDYFTGMFKSREEAEQIARNSGWKTRLGKNICPQCIKEQANKNRQNKGKEGHCGK